MTQNQLRLLMAVGGVVAGYLVYRFVQDGADSFNPASPDNIINQAASAGVEKASGGRFLSVGDALFNLFNPDAPGEDSFGKKLRFFLTGGRAP